MTIVTYLIINVHNQVGIMYQNMYKWEKWMCKPI